MSITNASYYQTGIKFIPDAKGTGTVIGDPTNGTIDKLESFIIDNERLLSLNFLNIDLYDDFTQDINDLDNAQYRWKNLLLGVTYIKDDVTYRFDGLRGFNKDSLVAYYVFCKYLINDETYYSTTGVVKTKSKNALIADSTPRLIDNYYAFLNKYQDKVGSNEPKYYCQDDVIVGVDYYNESKKGGLVTLETFLRDHKEDYEGYSFTRFQGINSFGI